MAERVESRLALANRIAQSIGGSVTEHVYCTAAVTVLDGNGDRFAEIDLSASYAGFTIYCRDDAEKLRLAKRVGRLVNPQANFDHTDDDGTNWLSVDCDVEGEPGLRVNYYREHDPDFDKCQIVEGTSKSLVCPVR